MSVSKQSNKVLVYFQVRYENTNFGDAVYICGNCPELANWQEENALRLDCRDANWYVCVAIEPDKPIEYKYFFRNAYGTRWEATTHKRRFNVSPGEIVEARDRWHDEPDFIQDVASTSFIQDVCMSRDNPKPMPTVGRPANGDITIVFEVNVPLISPQESVRLIGQSRKVPFWRIAESQVLSDLDCPIFRGSRTFKPAEMPVRYKFVLSHDLGWECENIELGEDNQCFAPRHFNLDGDDASVFITDEANPVPHRISIKDAIAQGICAKPDHDYLQIIFIESNSFRYPKAPEFRAAGMVLPVFSMRTRKSLGCGEFTDIEPLALFCKKAGLRLLQLLPITDTTVNFIDWKNSYPYSSVSSFALHPIYMNIDSLAPLPADVTAALPAKIKELDLPVVDYEKTLRTKLDFMRKIFELHRKEGILEKDPEFAHFQEESKYWLNSYCAFKALAELHKTTNWQEWPEEHREEAGLKKLVEDMNKPGHAQFEVVLFHKWVQYHLDKQLRNTSQLCANKYHVGLKGDVPIGVDPCSSDTWYFRRYFKLDTKAGAPPDAFAQYGQNWGFPTYNWTNILEDNCEWWANRLKVMGRFFHAYRIDHILGFFRIWEIPHVVASGLHARFFPGYMVSDDELHRRGLNNDFERLTRPIITVDMVKEQFGPDAEEMMSIFLEPTQHNKDELQFKKEFPTEVSILERAKTWKHITPDTSSDKLQDFDIYMRKFWILTNSVCLYSYGPGQYVPRFDVRSTKSCQLLGADWQNALEQLATEYFHKWHQDQWEWSALQKFPKMKEASRMLVCGEDLGLLSPIVPKVMSRFHILGLRIMRMSSDPTKLYLHPAEYPYDVVAATSTHDMPPLRAWWTIHDYPHMTEDEQKWLGNQNETHAEEHIRDLIWYNTLGNPPPRPHTLPANQLERLVDMHMYSPAMLAMFPYQDLMAIFPDYTLVHEDPWKEIINVPAIRNYYWRYRIIPYLEDLANREDIIEHIREKIIDSGRLRAH